MPDNGSNFDWPAAGIWLWGNKEFVMARIKEVRGWLFPGKEEDPTSSILIIGPGGVGKSTAAQMLASTLLEASSDYEESVSLESYTLEDDNTTELIVPPGQQHRRDATWPDLQATIGAGGYRGIILIGAYGYHTLGEMSYKHHRLYRDDDEPSFLGEFLTANRTDEIEVLRRLCPHICTNGRRSWLLTLVTKQDLWWDQHQLVKEHYRSGAYGTRIAEMIAHVGGSRLRHELVLASLIINNFSTGVQEVLATTASGYDRNLQVASVQRLYETLYALKEWEENQ